MIKDELRELIQKFVDPGVNFTVSIPPAGNGDLSTNAAFLTAKKVGNDPMNEAQKLADQLSGEGLYKECFEKYEIAKPGFLNFYFKPEFLQHELKVMSETGDEYFDLNSQEGKTIMIEYTDPNPFKAFHIGHLMPNVIGESLARIFEVLGARVIRVNYQGDVGLQIAKAIWGMQRGGDYLGSAYVLGSKAYKEDDNAKKEIDEINKKVYDGSDSKINELYQKGRDDSLKYFEDIYERLGTKFDHYFFESQVAERGIKIIKDNPQIFEKSDGAIIFPGENYGLHTRVFVSSQGLPTYEAKELALNKEKFELYNLDLSLIVTGNEIVDYFKVLKKAMEMVMPEVAEKTVHLAHGMLRLPTGKMSSRTGEVITAEWLINETKSLMPEGTDEAVAIAAIKYSILKQSIGRDIVFDFDKSISFHGDSGPYLQYTYARIGSIQEKVEASAKPDFTKIKDQTELEIVKTILHYDDAIGQSAAFFSPHILAGYIFQLSNLVNKFYESVRIMEDEDKERQAARLQLVSVAGNVLEKGIKTLGIIPLKKI